ncbi:hypothetical protein SAMN04490239_0506 [Rhodococcus koreensis]|uniref:Uncharacterized protein n=1 Tax=Rhodococcus koreensis TaxID=99653 RepID=A0A1H4IDT4_9NOCA|nr:hypothetical protein SAMN04490239_0506 [Rhodococcus koreensis]
MEAQPGDVVPTDPVVTTRLYLIHLVSAAELDLFLLLGMVEVSSRLPIRKGPTMADKSAVKSSKQSARALKERRAEKREKALESTEFIRKRKS